MPIVRQVVSCPACGASRRFSDMNLDEQGQFLADPEDRKVYPPVVKLNTLEGGRNCSWSVHNMPAEVLVGIAAQLRHALADVDARLADLGVLG
jgi:hypothetical protein